MTTAEYRDWARSLSDEHRARLQRAEHRLIHQGPNLGRPIADSVRGSKYSNMKELRPARTLRAFYVLDPWQRVLMLCGGDKSAGQQGEKWYRKMIRRADRLYGTHLASLSRKA
ncbi:type II toxin-antitoxin system RelE/ParE family toxin [Candidatus Poriferisodalis sp.]|uniref:type II toxin-antitoxin system RelE/ParE family toxin n=1 Tax=Candidatus Poriferisodalis sp. TaxID=3101277 RepID=UPI003C70193E